MKTSGYHSSVYVVHARGRVYDAFWDYGWENHTRFLIKKGQVIWMKGQELSKEDEAKLLAAIKANQQSEELAGVDAHELIEA